MYIYNPVTLPDKDVVREIVMNGLSRSEFERMLETRALNKTAAWPNTTNPWDVVEAFKFMYTDWPYYDDPLRNRDMLSKVIFIDIYLS